MRCVRNIIAAVCLCSVALAQEPGIELEIDSRVLEIGEAVDVQLVCTNTGEPDTPQCVIPDGLELQLAQATPSQSSMVSIVNGRRTSRTTYTYHLSLVAVKEGTYTLGPLSVVAGGTKHETEPVRIVVRQSSSLPKGDGLVFVEINVEPETLYITQTYTATLRLGIRKVIHEGRVVEADLLRNVLDQRRSQLWAFAGELQRRSHRSTDTWLTDSDGNRHPYEVFTFNVRLVAEQSGEVSVGPVFVRIDYPTRLERSVFGRYNVAAAKKATARANATITVKTPPEEGRPDAYSGAIGRFDMAVTAKPTRVEKGQPVTLTIAVTGDPLAGVAGPDLGAQPELASRFDYTQDELVGSITGRTKVFRKAVFPKQEGEQTIPPIAFSYFDVVREEYVTVTSDPIDLVVDPSSNGSAPISLVDESATSEEPEKLTVIPGGISPNYVDADLVLVSQGFVLSWGWIASIVLAPLGFVAVTVVSRRRERLRNDAGLVRRRVAHRNAESLLRQAGDIDDPCERMSMVGRALVGFVCDWLDLPPGHLTPTELRSILLERGCEPSVADGIAAFVESCDQARYAGGSGESSSTDWGTGAAREWMKVMKRLSVRAFR